MPLLGAIVALVILIADQVAKWSVLAAVARGAVPTEVTSFLNLVIVYNRGVSFGLFAMEDGWGAWLFAGIGGVIVVLLVLWLARVRTPWLAVGLGGVLGGAIGNIIDRIVHGGVVDYLDFHVAGYHWPAFNVADSAIVCGVGLMLVVSLFGEREAT